MAIPNPTGTAQNLRPNRGRKPGDPKPPPGTPGGGRKKGVPNKTTRVLREAILESFDKVGGIQYLVRMAKQEPRSYLALLAKILPTKVEAEVTLTASDVVDRLQSGRNRVAELRAKMVEAGKLVEVSEHVDPGTR